MSTGQIRVLVLLIVLAIMEIAIQPKVKAYMMKVKAGYVKGLSK